MARINTDGSLDTTYTVGTGFTTQPSYMEIQSDDKVLVVGGYTTYNSIGRNRIVRINTDGSIDNTFDPGTGFDSSTNRIDIQSDGKILVTGAFTSYNGISRTRIARIAGTTVSDVAYPMITSVTSSSANGAYKLGDNISIQVVFDEAVDVDTSGGTPQLTLETGTTDATANYSSGSGTNTLTFTYTIGEDDASDDLDYTSISALSLNG